MWTEDGQDGEGGMTTKEQTRGHDQIRPSEIARMRQGDERGRWADEVDESDGQRVDDGGDGTCVSPHRGDRDTEEQAQCGRRTQTTQPMNVNTRTRGRARMERRVERKVRGIHYSDDASAHPQPEEGGSGIRDRDRPSKGRRKE